MKVFRCVPIVALLASAVFLPGCNMAGSSPSSSGSGGSGTASAGPAVAGISPNSGPTTGGTTVNIKGSNFTTGALVFFGAVAAAGITVNGTTQIQAVAPSVSNAGAVSLVVQNSDGHSASLANGFTYTSDPSSSSPTITGVSPSTASPGIQVTLNGTNFASGASVTVGGSSASNVQFLSPSQLTATVPNLSPGTYDVAVANTNGLSATLSSALTIAAPQSLLSGCTVNASNQPTCALPAGWTDVVNESFEGGKLGNTGIESISGGSIECSNAHSGSCALQGNFTSSENTTYWTLARGAIGSSHEIYVSWWEMSRNEVMNGANDYTIHFEGATGDGGPGHTDLSFDKWNSTTPGVTDCLNGVDANGNPYTRLGGYLCQNAENVLETFFADGSPATAHYGQTLPFPTSWTQFELHYKANTPGNSDGDAELYRDGQLILSVSGNLNRSSTMDGMDAVLGTYYEASAFYTSSAYTACVNFEASSYYRLLIPFTSAAPCPVPPNFTKYWDDVIVMRK